MPNPLARLAPLVRDVRGWAGARWWTVAGVTVGYLGIIEVFGRLISNAEWWSVVAIALVAPLMGLWAATLVNSRVEMAVCDLKAICFGVCGMGISVTRVATFDDITSIVLSVATVAGVAWGAWERLHKEHVSAANTDDNPGEVCTTCAPLFPKRAG